MDKAKSPKASKETSRLSQVYNGVRQRLPDTSVKWLALLAGLSVGLPFYFYPEIHQMWRHYMPKPGAIYLESPEIYTRERMINERLTEDSWLREQLEAAGQLKMSTPAQTSTTNLNIGGQTTGALPKTQKPTAETSGEKISTEKASNKPAASTKVQSQSQSPSPTANNGIARISNLDLAFGQLFKLRSSARSLVRQRLIENRLDDRHDIDENTLYVLKFDTTVVDAPINQRRAKIEVEISGPRGNPIELKTRSGKDGAPRIRGPLKDNEITEIYLENPDTIDLMHTTYDRWLKNVQLRIVENAFQRLKNYRKKEHAVADNWWNRLKNEYHVGPSVLQNLREDGARRVFFAVEAIREVLQVQEGLFSIYFEEDDLTVDMKDAGSNKDLKNAATPLRKTITISASALSPYALINVVLTPNTVHDAERYIHFVPRTHSVTVANKGCLQPKHDPKAPIFYSGNFVLPGKADRTPSLDMIVYAPAERVSPDLRTDLNIWPKTLIDSIRKTQQNRPEAENKLFEKDPLGAYSDITNFIKDGNIPGLPGLPIANPAKAKELCHQVLPLTLNTGFIAFLRKMLRHRSFSYSVLPRDNAVVTLNEMKRIMALNFGTKDQAGPNVNISNEEASLELKPTLTTFGETAQETQNPVVGWIIDPAASFPSLVRRSDYVTVSESVLAIVSVPAWWPQINLEIKRSWIDRRGAHEPEGEEGGLSRKITVALPKDDRVLDTQLFGELQKKPKIERIEVGYRDPESWAKACETSLARHRLSGEQARPTSVIIAGDRLWRNTVVTLGGRRASRIELMPDMRGVIAYFECPIDFSQDASVAVWTSEGAHVASLCEKPGTDDDIERPWKCQEPTPPARSLSLSAAQPAKAAK